MYSIMIVEDEYLVRQGIASLVNYEQYGMQVIAQAENGIEAWKKFQKNPADILLTDINMPQMNGIELAKLVRDQAPKCHIVFLTGYDDFDYARTAIKLGADDYLLKPFSKIDVEEMLAKVQTKLDKERKKAQIQNLVDQGQHSELEEAIHARLADSELSLKSLAFQLGFSPSYLCCSYQKRTRLALSGLSDPRADEKSKTLTPDYRFEDL